MATTGQTINDRLNAVRYALVGQGLARTVCKATTEEILGPKRKHIDYLIACTNEPNVSIPQLANLLIERTQHTSWAVVFKGLTTIHHLMSYGNERFTQYLATSNHSFELNDFMDRTTPQGYTMSTFVRRYAKYINDKSISYRTLAIDLCKIRSGNDNALRTMNMDNLSKTLPIVQKQFDSLLEFEADTKDLNNGVIMAAFRLLYKDLVRLYVAYQEAIINLLERYFKLSRRKTREALDMYKKYLARMDKVAGFLQIVDAVGLDKSEMPDLTKSPASILEILEKHLASLEAKKRGATPTSPEAEDEQAEESAAPDGEAPADNKENKPPSPAVAVQGEAPTETVAASPSSSTTAKDKDNDNDNDQQQQSSSAAPTGGSGGGSGPPKKPPARPSPVVSPKVSPSGSKPAAATTAAAPEKKAPPERPAKPPSRPPPPSAATATPTKVAGPSSSSTSSSSSAPAPPPKAPTAEAANKTTAAAPPAHPPPPPAGATPSPTPPPPPPPPPPAPPAETTPVADPNEPEMTTNEQPQDDSNNNSNNGSKSPTANGGASTSATGTATGAAAGEGASETLPSCSTNVVDSTTTAQVDESQTSLETNHVSNNVENNHHEPNEEANNVDEMPPPPPPIEEDDLHHHQDEQQQRPQDIEDQAAPAPGPEPPREGQPEADELPSAGNGQVNGQNGQANNDNNGERA